MRFFYHYPETTGTERDLLEAGDVGEVAAAAERAGFDGFALTEHPVPSARWLANGGHQSLDPFVALGFAAAATSRIQLLTHLAVAPYRNPFLLAKAAATLDRLSHGRFVLGLGAGYQKSEFFALGVDFDERNELFDEVLDVLPLHWSGEPFSYRGRHFSAQDVLALPRPGRVPVWIGGNSARARRRVAERAEGWMPMFGSSSLSATARTTEITSLAQLASLIREVSDAAGGRPLEFLYSYQGELTVDADRHREALAEIEKAGVTSVVVSSPSVSPAATAEFLALFGELYL